MYEVLFTNGKFHTQDPLRPLVSRVGVSNGRIISLGDDIDESKFAAVIDLGGETVLPGFYDAHCHLTLIGESKSQVDLSPQKVRTTADLLAAIDQATRGSESGKWVVGSGYDQNHIGDHPTAEQIDSVSNGHPVYLIHKSRHLGVGNSKAFELAGYAGRLEVPDTAGGRVLRDVDGRAVGLLEQTAKSIIMDAIPKPSLDDVADYISFGSDEVLQYGITSITEPGVGAPGDLGLTKLDIAAFQLARDTGRLKVRATVMPYLKALGPIGQNECGVQPYGLGLGVRTGLGDDSLSIGAVKVFSDGSLIGRTAYMCCDYAGSPGQRGALQFSQHDLRERLIGAHVAGWQIAAHAVGDAAVDVVLDIIEAAQRQYPRPDARHRIEHLSIASDEQIQRIQKLGIVVVPQGRFIHELGDGVIAALGQERAKLAYRIRSLQEAGIVWAGSSDAPVVNSNPILNIHSLVNRRTAAGAILSPDESITVEKAVMAYTMGSAYASHQEKLRGSIAVGKVADFAVLSNDIFAVEAKKIEQIQVIKTIVGGKIAYSRG